MVCLHLLVERKQEKKNRVQKVLNWKKPNRWNKVEYREKRRNRGKSGPKVTEIKGKKIHKDKWNYQLLRQASCLKRDRDVSWWNPSCYRRQTAELALASAARLLILTWIINLTHSSLFRPAVDSLHYGGCVYITECIVCQKLPAYELLDGGKRGREKERRREKERVMGGSDSGEH